MWVGDVMWVLSAGPSLTSVQKVTSHYVGHKVTKKEVLTLELIVVQIHHCCVLIAVCVFVFVQEEYYGRELILADRDMVEQEADEILKGADVSDVAFLVVGDPFG